MAELAWPDKKAAVLNASEKEYLKVFEKEGWKAFLLEDITKDTNALTSLFQ